MGDGKHHNRVAHRGVEVACMDVCCFEEESSDTIIYCFCADLETVKGADVNPEVETPSTHLPVQARAMDVCCFEEESSDTIIYCFCADLETVKGAVVNPEVETPSTLCLRVQSFFS